MQSHIGEDTFGDVYRLDLERKHWSIGALAQAEWTPGRRTNHAAVADADGRMYIFGGHLGAGACLRIHRRKSRRAS